MHIKKNGQLKFSSEVVMNKIIKYSTVAVENIGGGGLFKRTAHFSDFEMFYGHQANGVFQKI